MGRLGRSRDMKFNFNLRDTEEPILMSPAAGHAGSLAHRLKLVSVTVADSANRDRSLVCWAAFVIAARNRLQLPQINPPCSSCSNRSAALQTGVFFGVIIKCHGRRSE